MDVKIYDWIVKIRPWDGEWDEWLWECGEVSPLWMFYSVGWDVEAECLGGNIESGEFVSAIPKGLMAVEDSGVDHFKPQEAQNSQEKLGETHSSLCAFCAFCGHILLFLRLIIFSGHLTFLFRVLFCRCSGRARSRALLFYPS